MKPLDFYETVAIVCPGVVFLLGLYWFCPAIVNLQETSQLFDISLGSVALYLVIAFICGHFIQAIAKIWEWLFWAVQGGMPTTWMKKDGRLISKSVYQQIKNCLKKDKFELNEDTDWSALHIFLKNSINDSSKRIYIFNSQYGMFRGISCSCLCLALLILFQNIKQINVSWNNFVFCILLIILGVFRMRYFAVCYAKELYMQYLTSKKQDSK